jgi:hypothetical protein
MKLIGRLLAFVVLAFVALLVIKIALGLLGVLLGLFISVLVLAAFGYVFFLILRVISPATAARVQDAIRGRPKPTQSP